MRNKKGFIIAISTIILAINSNVYAQTKTSRLRSFDAGWKFLKDSIEGAELPSYDDSKWRMVDVPHDWSIEDLPNQNDDNIVGPFDKSSIGATATGYTVGGIGWYRKKFSLAPSDTNKVISICFDGVYMDADVWINGDHLGNHPYGYTSFYYDITSHCKPVGDANIVAVRVRNTGQNSRWYSGSGIFRHVWLTVTDRVYIKQWSVYITTSDISKKMATVNIAADIVNATPEAKNIILHTSIIDPSGKRVSSFDARQDVAANSAAPAAQELKLPSPVLWSPASPKLYRAEVEVISEGQVLDKTISTFGIRSLQFSADAGFVLNGEKILLKGGCMHQDNGLLGSAAIDRAEERRVALMKANGFNAIRCSHNPPSPAFLDACDRLGMLVIDEAFDMWEVGKNPQDYHRFFDDWWQRDIQSMVLRDRNHPSVILWSIGNEISERGDTSGVRIAKQLTDEIHRLDPTRLTTAAICEFWDHPGRPWEQTAPAFTYLGVGGYNYQWGHYEPDHEKFPQRIMVGTESVPKDAFDNWQQVKKHSWVVGDFVWTGMDYLGETGIGHAITDSQKNMLMEWPWFNAFCGDIDLVGNKKPQSYYRDVLWGRSKITMAVHQPIPENKKEIVSYWGWPAEEQSWDWKGQEGNMMDVAVYSSCQSVRLELNGKLIGEQTIVDSNKLTARFHVPYAPGQLKAIGIDNGKPAASFVLNTTGMPMRLRLKADRATIKADRNDLAYISVDVTDDKGRLVNDAAVPIHFSINGDGEMIAGNADPSDIDSFRKPVCNSFKGKCLVIVRPKGKKGNIILHASAKNIPPSTITIKME